VVLRSGCDRRLDGGATMSALIQRTASQTDDIAKAWAMFGSRGPDRRPDRRCRQHVKLSGLCSTSFDRFFGC
jgi:hypothetical protein